MNCQQSKSPLGIAKAWSSGPGFFTLINTDSVKATIVIAIQLKLKVYE